jgi:hypothetical protein
MKAQERDEWRSRIKKAKARFGLWCHCWWWTEYCQKQNILTDF